MYFLLVPRTVFWPRLPLNNRRLTLRCSAALPSSNHEHFISYAPLTSHYFFPSTSSLWLHCIWPKYNSSISIFMYLPHYSHSVLTNMDNSDIVVCDSTWKFPFHLPHQSYCDQVHVLWCAVWESESPSTCKLLYWRSRKPSSTSLRVSFRLRTPSRPSQWKHSVNVSVKAY